MSNSIPEKQKQEDFLHLNFAYHRAYEKVARLKLLRRLVEVGVAIVVPAIATWFPATKDFLGLVTTLLVFAAVRVYFKPRISSTRGLGAKIQDAFDRGLFELPWAEIVAGDRPPVGEIDRLAQQYINRSPADNQQQGTAGRIERLEGKKKRLEGKKKWYPVSVGRLPLPAARLVCQRANCMWDNTLRLRFEIFNQCAIAVLLVVGLGYAYLANWSVRDLSVAILIPLLPAISGLIDEMILQREAASFSDRLRRSIEKAWKEYLESGDDQVVSIRSEYIQDHLFDRRSEIDRVPAWFYSHTQQELNAEMETEAKAMINEFESSVA